jgi:hypothetical protein
MLKELLPVGDSSFHLAKSQLKVPRLMAGLYMQLICK